MFRRWFSMLRAPQGLRVLPLGAQTLPQETLRLVAQARAQEQQLQLVEQAHRQAAKARMLNSFGMSSTSGRTRP